MLGAAHREHSAHRRHHRNDARGKRTKVRIGSRKVDTLAHRQSRSTGEVSQVHIIDSEIGSQHRRETPQASRTGGGGSKKVQAPPYPC